MNPSSLQRNREARREELVAAGIALLAREGVEAATMRRLAAAADCTTGAITHYFADRDALLLAMLRQVHRAAGERMAAAIAAERTPRERLRAVLLHALPLDAERLIEWKVWLAFWGVVAGARKLAAEHAGRYAEWRAMLLSLVQENGVRGEAAERLTAHLIAVVDGFGLQLTLARSSKDVVRLRGQCFGALAAALMAEDLEIRL